jgi:hypothetical protein
MEERKDSTQIPQRFETKESHQLECYNKTNSNFSFYQLFQTNMQNSNQTIKI